MTDGIQVGDAHILAREAHEGQTDKAGEPYILHPQTVANIVRDWGYGPTYQAVAYLHDVLEDTHVTEQMLRAHFDDVIVEAVLAITHRKGESRADYLARVKANPIALIVKHADNQTNSDEDRLVYLPDRTSSRLRQKYAKDRKILGPRPEGPS